MKKLFFIILAVVLLLWFVSSRNLDYKSAISNLIEKDQLQQSGELKFRAYLLSLVPMAEATIGVPKEEDFKGKQVYHLTATVKNLDYLSKLFSAYAIFDSYMDRGNFNVLEYKQKIVVTGKQDLYREAVYDQEKGTITVAGISRQIFPNTQDHLTLIANIRRMDLDKAKNIEFSVNTNQKNYIFEGTVEPKDILIKGKAYRIYIVKSTIRRKDKNPYHKSKVDIVLLKNGSDNTPVLIKILAGGFLNSVKLTEIK
jgi:hypothetical protein